jgi:protein O-GlcNAc transferase
MLLKFLRALRGRSAARLIERGLALRAQGDLAAAERVLREAAAAFPRDAVAAVNLALVLLEQNRAEAGAAELQRALVLDPANGAAHYNFANLLRNSGQPERALGHFRQAAQAQPAVPLARQELMFALLESCAWDEAEREAALLRAQCAARSSGWMAAIAPLTATYLELDDTDVKAVAAWHAAQAARDVAARAPAARAGGGRLRIGYLSPDFREHPVGQLMAAALPLHDRARFEVIAYSYGADDASAVRRGIAGAVDRFVDVAAQSDAAVAAQMAHDGVQVAVDLAGHTTGGRLGILARRPAPVQAHYLGYAATTGAPCIDYFIADAVATPPELAGAFTERLACVPACFMVGGDVPARGAPPSRASQGLPAEATVYSNFANASRITRAVFGVWMEILGAVPGSVLWLRQSQPAVIDRLRDEAKRCGIDPARLVFAGRVADRGAHVARLALADLSLDTIGWHNGHSTTSELLWAGVPVLTAPGRSFASRVGASLVTAAGLPEMVARDARDYVEIAVRLGRARAACDALRSRLAANRNSAPLFDRRGLVAGLEAVYLEMWRQFRAGGALQAIDLRQKQ